MRSFGRLIFALLGLLSNINVDAQEKLVPLGGNAHLRNTEESFRNQMRFQISLPFADDFNQVGVFPNPSLWEDNFVYINNTLGIDPPSLGVATFDGLNPLGMPYSLNNSELGVADRLTSKPIDLSGLTNSNNVYLSFYWQNGGRGDLPEVGRDFFFLEFLDSTNNWVEVKRIAAQQGVQAFKQEFVQVLDSFLHEGFQFRFGSVGILAGNVDVWNLDYVKLDQNRNPATESSVPDLSYVSGASKFFKDYYQLPYRHFTPEMLADSGFTRVKNNFLNTVDIVDNYSAVERRTGNLLDNYSGPSEDVPSQSLFNFNYPGILIPEGLTGDTVIVDVRYFFNTSAENNSPDYVRANNELKQTIVFNNAFAYDDGSAERAYRLENFDFGQFAVGFRTTIPDTLRAVRIHFPYFPNYAAGQSLNPAFNLVIWSSIDTIGGDGGEVLYRHDLLQTNDFAKPLGLNEVNDFSYYTIQPELNDGKDFLLVDGNFFIGLEFEKGNGVDVGFDANTVGNKHSFFNIGRGWFQSQFSGSLMINAIVGAKLSGIYTGLKPNTLKNNLDVKVYPNPAQSNVFAQMSDEGIYRYEIFNTVGQLKSVGQIQSNGAVHIGNLEPGLYIFVVHNELSQERGYAKFIKQ